MNGRCNRSLSARRAPVSCSLRHDSPLLWQEEFLACMDKRMQAVLQEASTVAAHLASPAAPLTGGPQLTDLGCSGQEANACCWARGVLCTSDNQPLPPPLLA